MAVLPETDPTSHVSSFKPNAVFVIRKQTKIVQKKLNLVWIPENGNKVGGGQNIIKNIKYFK